VLVAAETAVEEEHQAGVDLASGRELAEVADVRRDEHAIFAERELEHLRIGAAEALPPGGG
jgi:hypothetical protein